MSKLLRRPARPQNLAVVSLLIAFVLGPLAVRAQQGAATNSVQNPFLGSVPSGRLTAEPLQLTLREAIDRGLRANLGLLLSGEETKAANGGHWQALSRLLPQVNGAVSGSQQEINLHTLVGPNTLPATIPPIAGPFHVFDSRLQVSAPLFNLTNLESSRAASHRLSATRDSYQQARNTVVLAVGNAYLIAIAGKARVQAATAERNTAQVLYQLARDRESAGLNPQIDTLRALVEYKAQQENLLSAENDLAIERLNLARAIGLPDGQPFRIVTRIPFRPIDSQNFQADLVTALQQRGDYRAAIAEVSAAKAQVRAARAERLPSIGFKGYWGDAGTGDSDAHQNYQIEGSLSVPLFQGGRVHGDMEVSEARLHQAQEKLADLKEQIAYDVRTALLNLSTAAQQVEVAKANTKLAGQTLDQARDRFSSGVTNNVEVVQAQQAVAQADRAYIASLYQYNISKLNLTRAMGIAERNGLNYLGEK